jgi:hypothetical protein
MGFSKRTKAYQAQVLQLTKKGSGPHFLPSKITNEQLMENKIENLSTQMNHHAPDLWRLIANLLAADQRWVKLAYRKHFPNFSCTRLQIFWTVHSGGVAALRLGLLVEDGVDNVLIVL